MANIDRLRKSTGKVTTADLRLRLQKSMQKHAAVFRTGDILQVRVDGSSFQSV